METPTTTQNIDEYVPEDHEDTDQSHELGNRVKYQKLLSIQWKRLENKNFSQFEQRVLDTLMKLGNNTAEETLKVVQVAAQQKVPAKEDDKKKKKQSKKELEEEKKQQAPQQATEVSSQELYLQVVRSKLQDLKYVAKLQEQEKDEEEEEEETNTKKKATKKGGKKGGANAPKKEDLMRIQLSKDKVADSVVKMLSMMGQASSEMKLYEEEFLKVEQASKRIKSLKWLELKFAALIVYSNQIINSRLESRVREEYAFELIYFLKNVYNKYKDYEGLCYLDATKKEFVSSQSVKDLRKKLGDLNKTFHFSNRILFNRYPRLVIDTDLNQAFNQTDVQPYQAQKDLIKCIADTKKPLLVFLNTMVGTGKTVLSVSLTQYLQKIRDKFQELDDNQRQQFSQDGNLIMNSDLDKMQLLYCCPLDNVRTQVGSAAYIKKLQFAIASMWKNPNKNLTEDKEHGYTECPRLVNSWQNKNSAFPTLVVSDFQTTLELLKERFQEKVENRSVIRWQGFREKTLADNPSKNGNQYILFIDEPTVDADFPNAKNTEMLTQIMRYAPPITILSSATLPDPKRLPNFIKLFQKRYGDIQIETIQSQQFQIGCQVFSHNGKKFLPHYNVKTKEQLKTVLDRLKQNPFMQRCYNANAYCELYDRAKRFGMSDLEDFEQFDLITQEIVQKKSNDLLNRLLLEDEDLLQKICAESTDDLEEEEEDEDGQMTLNFGEEEKKTKEPQIDPEDKIRFAAPYKTLRVRDLAGKMAHKFNGGCLIAVNEPVKLIRESFSWLLKDTLTAQEYIRQYEKQLELLGKLKVKKEKEIDNEDERSKQVQAIEENMNIAIEFPDKLKINTLEHYKKFVAKNKIELINRYRARKAFSLEGINLSLGVPDDIMLYLFSGIAAYTEKASDFPSDYFEEIQNLASNGQLAFIVSDDSMCYGVNYPLNHVIVYDEMAQKRSMGALFQLIGRAGRVGVSWVANAYLEEKTFNRLINYLEGKDQGDEEQQDEATNMENLAKKLIEQLASQARAKRAQKAQEEQQQ